MLTTINYKGDTRPPRINNNQKIKLNLIYFLVGIAVVTKTKNK